MRTVKKPNQLFTDPAIVKELKGIRAALEKGVKSSDGASVAEINQALEPIVSKLETLARKHYNSGKGETS